MFLIFKINLFFKSRFGFSTKLSSKNRESPHIACPSLNIYPLYQHLLLEWCICYNQWPQHPYLPYTLVFSQHLAFCGFWEMYNIMVCVSQLLLLFQNIWDIELKRGKGLFWVKVLEVLVHDQKACCFWVCGEIVYDDENTWQRKPLPSWQPRSERRDREEGLMSQYLSQGVLQCLISFRGQGATF